MSVNLPGKHVMISTSATFVEPAFVLSFILLCVFPCAQLYFVGGLYQDY